MMLTLVRNSYKMSIWYDEMMYLLFVSYYLLLKNPIKKCIFLNCVVVSYLLSRVVTCCFVAFYVVRTS